jgi:hypothetical protein
VNYRGQAKFNGIPDGENGRKGMQGRWQQNAIVDAVPAPFVG